MRSIKLPSGLIITIKEYRETLCCLNRLVVYSDTAILLKHELKQAVREGTRC